MFRVHVPARLYECIYVLNVNVRNASFAVSVDSSPGLSLSISLS